MAYFADISRVTYTASCLSSTDKRASRIHAQERQASRVLRDCSCLQPKLESTRNLVRRVSGSTEWTRHSSYPETCHGILICFRLERFSNDIRKTNTKVITLANHTRGKQRHESNRIPKNCPLKLAQSAGKIAHTQRAIGFGFEESSDAGLNRKRKRPENRLQEASCPLPLSDFFCLHFSVGYFVEPTIIETKNPEDKIMKEVKFPSLIFVILASTKTSL